jgi:hypothetical protein
MDDGVVAGIFGKLKKKITGIMCGGGDLLCVNWPG